MDLPLVKRLREDTGVSIMACKKALEKAKGDIEKAKKYLEKNSEAMVKEKEQRAAHQGVIANYVHNTKRIGSMVELRCETDFVANTSEFQSLAFELALHIAGMNPGNLNELYDQPYVRDPSRTVKSFITEVARSVGERVHLVRFVRYEIK